jgi:hypothetical protein
MSQQQPVEAHPPRFVLALIGVALLGVALAVWWMARARSQQATLGHEFEYDVEHYARPRPELLAFSQTAVIPTGLSEVRTLAVGPHGRVHVAGPREVVALDHAGRRHRVVELEGPASSLAFSGGGELFVALGDHVAVFDAAGAPQKTWSPPEPEALLVSLAVTVSTVFAADARHRVVWRYTRDGRLIGRVEAQALRAEKPAFIIPSPYFDVAIAPDGLLRVVNPGRHRIETYHEDGTLITAWGEASFEIQGFSGCCNPAHFAVLPDGRFVTSEKGLARVKLYEDTGEFAAVIADETTLGEDPSARDVATDPLGHVLVLDPATRTVHVYAPIEEAEADHEP